MRSPKAKSDAPRMAASRADRVLITGASAGIGAALARAYHARGARLLLLARRRERLEAFAGTLGALTYCGDVCKPEEVQAAIDLAKTSLGGLDVVIANAGFAVRGPIETLAVEDFRRQLETNVLGVIATVRAALPLLRASGGRLAIVGSVAASIPVPGTAAYSLSKAAVRTFTEILALELKGSGVSVTLLTPGMIESDIRKTDNFGNLHAETVDRVPRWVTMPADQAARIMVRAIDRRKREQIITWHAWFLLGAWRCLPGLMRPILARQRSYNARGTDGR